MTIRTTLALCALALCAQAQAAQQASTERRLLAIEHARDDDVGALVAILHDPDPRVQLRALHVAAQLENPALAAAIQPLLPSRDATVRAAAVEALAQIGAPFDFASLLPSERDGAVRAAIFESIGRSGADLERGEALLAQALADADPQARLGAARGIETLIRVNVRAKKLTPSAAAITALRQAVRDNHRAAIRELALRALNAAHDADDATFAIAMTDAEPQVRRLAVIGAARWVADSAPMVRYESVRLAASCGQAQAALADSSELVTLAAADRMGRIDCPAPMIAAAVDGAASWRLRAHALLALARVAPSDARLRLPAFAADPRWQTRAYAATAARLAKDESTRARLARDPQPNVAAEALQTGGEAVHALASDHAGLLVAAAIALKDTPELPAAVPQLLAALQRLSATGRATLRDPRVQILERLRESIGVADADKLRYLLTDRDPVVAQLAANVIGQKTGTTPAATTRYLPDPLPSESTLRALHGARARVVIRNVGSFTIALATDGAPLTVAAFAALADRHRYDGLTIHRLVPNFVIQGGSPGADEYVPLADQFMRDETGLRHVRGTVGISTRGRDTGDGQIFVDLVDTFDLDHTYTAFGQVVDGADTVARVLDGDIIESVRIVRKTGR